MENTSELEENKKVNIAYIDAANLANAMKSLGWQLDYKRFRVWLRDKYKIEHAYVFIGFINKYKGMYRQYEKSGFILIFKEVIYQKGAIKGNCDSDLIMQAAKDLYENILDKAVIVASDGDYLPLVKVLKDKDSIEAILSPAPAEKCSVLLKKTNIPIAYINDQRLRLEKVLENEKAPDTDETV